MRLPIALSVLVGLAAALDQSEVPRRSFRKRSTAVQSFDGDFIPRAANKPVNAPAGYETSLISATAAKRSTDALEIVPANVERRRASVQALRRLRRQVQPSDFFECQDSVCLPFACPVVN